MLLSRSRPSGSPASFARGRALLGAALAWLGLLAAGPAAAQTTSFTETVGPTYVFNNASDPFGGNPECALQVGTHTYSARTITATVSGTYTFTMSAATGLGATTSGTDPWAAIFTGDFNVASPTSGLLNCDDDTVNGTVRTPTLTVNLVAGQRYTLVTSNWQAGNHPGTATYQVTQPIVLAGPPVPQINVLGVGYNGLSFEISSDANGNLSWVVQSAAAPAPTPAQVQAGQDGNGAPAVMAGSNGITAGVPFGTTRTGLAPATAYRLYAVIRDLQTPPQTTATPAVADVTTLSDRPDAPTAVTAAATSNVGEVLVSFTPPSYAGASAISGYTVTSSPGDITATGASSPILVTGLTGGQAYTFTVVASNGAGDGPASAPSNAATPLSAPTLGTFPDLFRTFGDPDFDLVPPSSDSPGAFSYAISDPSVATVSGGTVTIVGVGMTTVTVTQAAAPGYVSAATTAQLVVSPAAPVITWAPGLVMTYGDAPQALPLPSSNSAGAFTYASAAPSVASVSGNMVAPVNIGATTITATQAADGNYTEGSVQMTVEVLAATPVLAWISDFSRTYGDAAFPLTAPTSPSDGGFTYASSDASVATVSGDTVTITGAGTVTLTATQAPSSDGNYTEATISVVMTVDKASPTLSWVGTLQRTWGEPAFALPPVVSNSTGAFSYASSDAAVATVSGNVVTMHNIGTTTITATQAEDANYLAGEVSLVLEVGAATPTLAWIADIAKTYGEPAFDLPDPSSPSPGAFTFTSADPSVATVDGRTVTIVGAGTTVLTATQAPSGNWGEGSVTTTLVVQARPDPTTDPSVAGTLQAQVDQAVRFATAQQGNIRDRLRQQRDAQGNADHHAVAIQMLSGDGGALALNAGPGRSSGSVLPEGWGLWSAGSISLGSRDPNAVSPGFDFRSDGLTLGADYRFGNGGLAGIALGYGWGENTLDALRSSVEGEAMSLAAYGLWRGERGFVDGLLGWGRMDFDIARYSSAADATARATRPGDQWFGSLTLGWDLGRTLVGYTRVDASRTVLEAYREHGLGIYDLAYSRQDVVQSTVSAGLEGRHEWLTSSGAMRPWWSLEYRQAIENRSDVGINYVVLPEASDYVLGLRSFADDGVVLGLGLDITITRGWQLALMGRHERVRGIGSATSFGLQLSWTPGGEGGPAPAADGGKR